jgi:hypothetical protein
LKHYFLNMLSARKYRGGCSDDICCQRSWSVWLCAEW